MDEKSKSTKGNKYESESVLNEMSLNEKEGPKDREILVALSKSVIGLFDGVKIENGRTALVNVRTRKVTYITDNVIRPFYRKQAIRN